MKKHLFNCSECFLLNTPLPVRRSIGAAICAALFHCVSASASPVVYTDTALTTPGLVGSYVNKSLETIAAADDWRMSQAICGTRIDPVLEFTTATWGSRAAVGVTGGSDSDWTNFSVQWDGWLKVTQAGQRYATVSDDGSRMWIDLNNDGVFEPEELLDNGWGRSQGTAIRDRSPSLAVGVYRIRIQYYEIGGGNEFHLVSPGWLPRQFTPAAGNPRQVVKVLVLNFEPRIPSRDNKRLWEVFDWGDPRVMARQFEADLEYATGGAIDIQLVDERHLNEFPLFEDGFRYSPDQYVQNRQTNTGWHEGVNADFYHLMRSHGVEELVNAGAVDEVWCFGDHFFGLFGEAWMAGPNSFFINGPSFFNIGFNRAIAGYGFNYERGIAEMIHDLSHRTENHGQRAFGGWNLANPVTAFDHFSANYLESSGHTAGVGTCHVPANADAHYDYANTRSVTSTAFDWANYPATTGATTVVSRDTWGVGPAPDYHRDYMNFYFGTMPRNAGAAASGRQANWFKYIWDFNSYESGTGLPRNEDAFAAGATVRTVGGSTHDFTVRYYDATGINVSTLGTGDVQVTGPGGFLQTAVLIDPGSEIATTAGTARIATYRITAPGGAWDRGDGGSYRVNIIANQVLDTLNNAVPSGNIGGFQVTIDDPSLIQVAQMLSSGQATVAHTTIDIGPVGLLFDGSVESLIRTPNIDPAVVTLTFANAPTIHGFRTYFSYANGDPAYRWKIETANTQSDLDSQTGSWRQTVAETGTTVDRFSDVTLASPVSAKLVRITATKVNGDDYVHFNEWQLLGPPVIDNTPPSAACSSLNVSQAGGTAHYLTATFTDATAIDVATLKNGNLRVTGPNGFDVPAIFHSVDNYFDGPTRTVTYWLIPPDGAWDYTDNGIYNFALQSASVHDTIGNPALAQSLGSFSVTIPPPVRRPRYDLAENNSAQWFGTADGGSGSSAHDASRTVLGDGSIKFTTDGGFDTQLSYRDASGSDWDLTSANNLYFSVYAQNSNSPQFQNNSPWLRLYDSNGGYFEFRHYQNGVQTDLLNTALNQWRAFTVPLRAADNVSTGWRRSVVGSPRLDHLASLEFHADTWGGGFILWVDRVGFDLPVSMIAGTFAALPSHRLSLQFDQKVADSLTSGDLALLNVTAGTTVNPATMSIAYDTANNLATITFPGLSGARLADGQYRLTITANAVADPAGNSLSAPYQLDFIVANDTDADGMPDAWENANGLNQGNPNDAAGDADGDGQTNLAEYRAGTNPQSGASRFAVTNIIRTGNGVELTWGSVAGRQYRIHWSDDQIIWTPLTSNGVPVVVAATGTSTLWSVSVANSSTRRFFRVEVLAP